MSGFMSVVLPTVELQERYEAGLQGLWRQFQASGNGATAAHGRSLLVDLVVVSCYQQLVANEVVPPDCVTILALGGYGRGTLLPHSDVDLLFLFRDTKHEASYKDPLSRIYLDLWDLKIRASATARTVAECAALDRANPEFTVSLLESRFLVGDEDLFQRVQQKSLPALLRKSARNLLELVAESARTRHAKYGNTIYHLEPNVKEGPGGLRDYNLACWLALVSRFQAAGTLPRTSSLFDPRLRQELDSAFAFLVSVRSFLHYRHGRDDNSLTWEAQDSAASEGIGTGKAQGASAWMREYFRNARSVHGAALQLLQLGAVRRGSVTTKLWHWSRGKGHSGLAVVDGAIAQLDASRLGTSADVFAIFERLADQPVRLGMDAQRQLLEVAPSLATPRSQESFWRHLRRILMGRYAAQGLRAMRDCGVLDALLPEFKLIDALVVRDFFHRYTVDEHSFLTIDTLHSLKDSRCEWNARFAEILGEIEKPELLYLSLLLHDFGKGVEGESHVAASGSIASTVLGRLGLDQGDRDTVQFLIQNHLDMSATARRDIFDAKVIGAFAAKVGTPEILKMLTLLTYADISSVNPDAMTEWKAENLWHLYVSSSNFLNRHVDDERVHGVLRGQIRQKFDSLPSRLVKDIQPFLEGLPQRYLRIYAVEAIVRHFELASRLWQEAVQTTLTPYRDLYEFTVVTTDKPFLFATLAGALSGWGMEIVKANAFSNAKGVVVDTFHFKDRFRTLDLNPSEHERLRKSIAEVIRGERPLEYLIRSRSGLKRMAASKVQVATKVILDDESSSHSTVLEVVAQDVPGLLYVMAQAVSELQCNIEIALIDTEGETALDVFYLTANGHKLPLELQQRVRESLLERLTKIR
jgi:[protein-PII] uridylyltransferase